jgi:hypothetical protein
LSTNTKEGVSNKPLDDGVVVPVETTDENHVEPYDGYQNYVAIAVADSERKAVIEYLKTAPEVQEITALANPIEFNGSELHYNILTKFQGDTVQKVHRAIYEGLDNKSIIHTATFEPMRHFWKRDSA